MTRGQGAGTVIQVVRPNLSLVIAAVVFGGAAGTIGGWQWAPLTVFAVLICAGVWRGLALLGHIAGALTGDDDD